MFRSDDITHANKHNFSCKLVTSTVDCACILWCCALIGNYFILWSVHNKNLQKRYTSVFTSGQFGTFHSVWSTQCRDPEISPKYRSHFLILGPSKWHEISIVRTYISAITCESVVWRFCLGMCVLMKRTNHNEKRRSFSSHQ